jgi:nitrogen fixation/metabolism regulation signal transduction histidine kinase
MTLLYVGARHATRKPLHLSLHKDGGAIRLQLRDEGKGFPVAVLERFKLSATEMDLANPESVLSVGLTAVKRVCDNMEWTLVIGNAQPEENRKCGTVTVYIPCS